MRVVALLVLLLVVTGCGPSATKLNASPLKPTGPLVLVADGVLFVDDNHRIVKLPRKGPSEPTAIVRFEEPVIAYAIGDDAVAAWTPTRRILKAPLDGSAVQDLGTFEAIWGLAFLGPRLFAAQQSGVPVQGGVLGAIVEYVPGQRLGRELSSAHWEPTLLRTAGDALVWLNKGRQKKNAAGVVTGHEGASIESQRPDETTTTELLKVTGALTAFDVDADELVWSDGTTVFRRARDGQDVTTIELPPREDASVVQLVLSDDDVWVRRNLVGARDDLLRVEGTRVSTIVADVDIAGDVAIAGGEAYVAIGTDVWRYTP